MRPVVYSASSVNAYQTCHLQWYFGYVMAEAGIVSEPQIVGIEVHDYAERRLSWTRFQQVDPRLEATMRELDRDEVPPNILPLAAVFDRDILPTYRDPILIEAPFQIEVDGIPFSGVIDSVDRQDVGAYPAEDGVYIGPIKHDPFLCKPDRCPGPKGCWCAACERGEHPTIRYANILRDLKTTNKRPQPGKYWFNMVGYFLGARDLGYEIDAIQLDYIVRTQHPYYWPEVVPLPNDDDITRWAGELHAVAGGVERADYEPTGLGTYVCKFCPFRTICGPYTRFKEVTG